jgi:hypothetical protein
VLEVSCFSAYKLSDVLEEPSNPTAESAYSSFGPTSSSEALSLDFSLNLTLIFTYKSGQKINNLIVDSNHDERETFQSSGNTEAKEGLQI